MKRERTDAERMQELIEQGGDLRARLAAIPSDDVTMAGDAAKLHNSLTQVQHEMTTLEHLKLQRAKAEGKKSGDLTNLPESELDARARKAVADIESARKRRKRPDEAG